MSDGTAEPTILDNNAGEPNPAPTGSGEPAATPDFRSQIPEAYRQEACLTDIQDMESLCKSYVHAQKMVGVDKIARPKDDWTPEQLSEFYNELGRPSEPDGYGMPEMDLPDELKPAEEDLKPFFERAHAAGLTKKQAQDVLGYYMDDVKQSAAAQQDVAVREQEEAQQSLQKEWGDKMSGNVQSAVALVTQLGSDGLMDAINRSGLGRNAEFIKFLSKAASPFMEDNPRAPGETLVLGGPGKAQQEIKALHADADFLKKYTSREAVGHKEAVAKMTQLQRIVAGE